MTGPCDWPVLYRTDCPPPDGWETDPDKERTDDDQILYESMAVEYLWNWTSRSLGVCEVALRPCATGCDDPRLVASTFEGRGPYGSQSPRPYGGSRLIEWVYGCGECSGCERLDPRRVVTLRGPVNSVLSVTIDGVVLDPEAYRLSGNRLIRQDDGYWPQGQDFDLPPGEPGTWEVVYRRGIEVPVGGQVAAGILALELRKAACGDKSCGLPQRVQSITRQGVTVAVLDAFDDIDKGHTGIWLIDSWLASMTKPPRRAHVLSPDVTPRNMLA